LALVVGGAAPGDHLRAVGARDQCRLERRSFPKIERIDRLHIIVPVEQNLRRLALNGTCPVRDHHRMARRRADRSLEPDRRQVGRRPVGCARHLFCISRISRDRRDAHKVEQASKALVEVGIDTGERGSQGHRAVLRKGMRSVQPLSSGNEGIVNRVGSTGWHPDLP